MSQDLILQEIANERKYQDGKWGTEFDDKNTATNWVAFICAYAGKAYTLTRDKANFRKCMVKVAALAVAAIEAIDRNGDTAPDHWQ